MLFDPAVAVTFNVILVALILLVVTLVILGFTYVDVLTFRLYSLDAMPLASLT